MVYDGACAEGTAFAWMSHYLARAVPGRKARGVHLGAGVCRTWGLWPYSAADGIAEAAESTMLFSSCSA